MKLQKKYKFYLRHVDFDSDIDTFFKNNKELSIFKKWYRYMPDFEAVYLDKDGYQKIIDISLDNVIYRLTEIPVSSLIKNAFVIGDDAGDSLYIYIYNNSDYASGIYLIDDTLDISSLSYVSPSMDDLFLDK